MTIDEMKLRLKSALNPKRLVHSLNVMDSAVKLAFEYDLDEEKAAVAGLLHDCARNIKGIEVFRLCSKFDIVVDNVTAAQPELLHGPIGAVIAKKEYGVTDESVLRAIYYHTIGHEDMEMLEKVIFIADYIEPGRDFPGVEKIRNVAFQDMDKAMVMAFDSTLKHIISKGALIHPDAINARNFIINMKSKN